MATVYNQRQYADSDSAKKWREQMEAQMAAKPADYQSQYRPQIDHTIDSILHRKEFQYDVNGDALWNQYKDRSVNLGQQAMMDTMGQAAQLTGGYGNSYAQMAGQQAYQGYLQGLTDKIPELAQTALDRYNQQGQDLYQKYGLLSSEDQNAYNQWLTNYNQYLTERDWLSNQYNTERGFDYGTYRDAVTDDQWKAQFDEDIRRFDFANQLGEFAPVASAGGGYYDSGYYGNPKPDTQQTVPTDTPMSHNEMVKDVQATKLDLLSKGMSPSQAEKGAQLMAGEWYQQYGKYR
jgi:hypothetical protein